MAKEEIIVDSISGKTREQLHKESEQDYSRKRAEAYALAEEQQLYAGLKGDLFRVDRIYRDSYDRDELLRGISREAAMKHCQDPETSSLTCTSAEGKARTADKGEWFDSWTIDMEATYSVGKVLGTTAEEYNEKLDIMPPAMQDGFFSDGSRFECYAMGEPIYHSDTLDAARSSVAVVTWYFYCSTPSDWGKLSCGRRVRLTREKERFLKVNETLSSAGRSRARLAVEKAYREGLSL